MCAHTIFLNCNFIVNFESADVIQELLLYYFYNLKYQYKRPLLRVKTITS